MAKLGITYVIQRGRNSQAESDGWILVAQYADLFMYRNPKPVSLAYLEQDAGQVPISSDHIRFNGNGLLIQLPALDRDATLTAAFTVRPGWKAYVSGKRREILEKEDRLIRVQLQAGDTVLDLKYQPFGGGQIGLSVAGSIILFLISLFFFRNTPLMSASTADK